MKTASLSNFLALFLKIPAPFKALFQEFFIILKCLVSSFLDPTGAQGVVCHQARRQAGKEAGKPAGKEARAIFKEVGAMPFGGLLFLELKGEGSRERAQGRGLKKEGSRGRSHALEGLVHSGKCFFLKF